MNLVLHLYGSLYLVAALQDAPAGQGGASRFIISLLPFLFLFGLLYILFILPTQRQQKKHRQMIAALKVGDKVVTTSGIYGTVVKVDEQTCKLRIADKVTVVIDKNAIAGHQPEGTEG